MSVTSQQTRVMITAGGSGIGRVVAETFLARGAAVHVCDIDAAALASFGDQHPEVGTTLCDVSDPKQVDQFFNEAQAHLGGLDLLVNNAGIGGPTALVEDVPIDAWDQALAVGIHSHFYCCRKAIPLLKANGRGLIINMSSSAGLHGYPMRSPYAAAKWAVIGLTKTLAMELGPHGIRANAICPGNVSGERMDRVLRAQAEASGTTLEEEHAKTVAGISMRTFVSPREIAEMIVFLNSEHGVHITGQAIGIDGHTETLRS